MHGGGKRALIVTCVFSYLQREDVCGGQEQPSRALILYSDTNNDSGAAQGEGTCALL